MASQTPEQLDSLDSLPGYISAVGTELAAVNYTEPLTEFLVTLEQAHLGYFAGQHDALGNAWAPLQPATVARKGSAVILVEHGDLRASLGERNSDSIREVAADGMGLVFGTMDEKAMFHQEGTTRMPARPPVGLNDHVLDILCNSLADHVVDEITK